MRNLFNENSEPNTQAARHVRLFYKVCFAVSTILECPGGKRSNCVHLTLAICETEAAACAVQFHV